MEGAVLDFPTGSIELLVELGIGRQAQAGVWDVSTWGDAVWGAGDFDTGDYVDVTCDVVSVDGISGASAPNAVVTEIDTTTGSIVLSGPLWNPWAGPYLGVLGPATPVRVSWRPHEPDNPYSWGAVFTGQADTWAYDRKRHRASVALVDPAGPLANRDLPVLEAPVGLNESITARMNRILDAAYWPVEDRDIPPDRTVPVIDTVLGGKAWEMLETAAETDLGIVWVTREGVITYRPVAQVGQFQPYTLDVVLTDDAAAAGPSGVCVLDYLRTDPRVLRNDVTISHEQRPIDQAPAVAAVRLTDDASIDRYGRVTYSRTDLIHANDDWSTVLAGAILVGGAWPISQPQVAELDVRADIRVADLLLSTEIADTITVLDSGRGFRCVIVGYSFTITRRALSGSLVLADVTAWQAGRWDIASWNTDRWGV